MTALTKDDIQTGGQVATYEPAPDPFLAMIERAASNQSFDIEKMDRLVAMRNAELSRQARVAFDSAFAEMQPKLPVIDRNGRIEIRKKDAAGERNGDVQQSSAYALWADIKAACNPMMLEHGFGISFRPKTAPDGKIIVTCILSHRGGHREEANSIPMQHDATGSKNAVQAVGSSLSYGTRYMGIMMLGIVTKETDDDGRGAVPSAITAEALDTFANKVESHKASLERLLKAVGASSLIDLTPKQLRDAHGKLDAWIAAKAETSK